jgi:uncharacterized protein (TIGR03435 family)
MRLILGIAIASFSAFGQLKFEAASIKPAKDDTGRGGFQLLPGGGLRLGGATAKMLISLAYDVREEQILGGPRWISSETYNILAKAEKTDSVENVDSAGPGSPVWNKMRERLRNLLKDRFQLQLQEDSKETSGYVLGIAKGGSKLQPSPQAGPARTNRMRGRIEARDGTMEMLAAVLTGLLHRPVKNRTGLDGNYDYTLTFEPDESVDGSAPSVFTAIQEQLGLKIESARVTMTNYTIIKIERPSAN